MVATICGTPKESFLKDLRHDRRTAAPNRAMTIMYALGWTQHSQGSEMIRTAAIVQLLLGNIGIAGGGMNALRGHSNIQGLTDLGLLSTSLPGYMSLPREAEQSYEDYIKVRALKPLRPNQMSYWQNYGKFFVSYQKTTFGNAATKDNDWAYDYLPKYDRGYDVLVAFELMNQGKMNGYICQGFNPVGSFPNKKKIIAGLSKLKWLVIIDPLATETSEFGAIRCLQRRQDRNHPDRSVSACVHVLRKRMARSPIPAAGCSGIGKRRAPGRRQGRSRNHRELFYRLRTAYAKDGGAFPDPIVNLTWPYKIQASPRRMNWQ